MFLRRGPQWIGLVCLLSGVGCAAVVPYRYGHFPTDAKSDSAADATGPEVEFGKPIKTLDGIARALGMPEQMMGLNQKIRNHAVSLDTVASLRSYLNQNDLADVSIYVNCYDPKEQWRRLRENHRVSAPWRYTLGTLSIVEYTLLPSRLFGGDNYNPYTNTLNIDSDVPAIALLEGAIAKNIRAHKYAGTYATLALVPGVGLVRRSHALGDVLGYARAQHDWETEKQAYHVVYSQVGAEMAATACIFSPTWWAMPALGAGGAAAGHLTGRMLANRRVAEIDAAAAAEKAQLTAAQPATSGNTSDTPSGSGTIVDSTATVSSAATVPSAVTLSSAAANPPDGGTAVAALAESP